MKLKKNNILIVGGTGFIGNALAKKVIKNGNQVYSFSTKKKKLKKKIKRVSYLKGDIKRLSSLKKAFKNKTFDHVVNCGGYVEHKNKKEVEDSHYIGTKNLYNFFKGKKIKSFIQIGSSSEYGDVKTPHSESVKCKPKGIYGIFKYKATKFLLDKYKKNKFPVTILRFYQLYGPHQDYNRFIPQLIKSSIKKKKFFTSEGKQFRDFLFIDDAINAIIKTMIKSKSKGQIINIGYGKGIKLKKIMNIVKKLNNFFNPDYGKIKMRSDEKLKVYPKIDKSLKILDWKPKISINKGLEITNKYYLKELRS